MYYEFSCRLPYTVASLRLSLINSQNERWNFPSLFLAKNLFVNLVAIYFRTSEDESALHNCSECETLRFFSDENLVQKYDRVWDFEWYTDFCFARYPTQFWYGPWCQVIVFFFSSILTHTTSLYVSLYSLQSILPANTSGSPHARTTNETIKWTRPYFSENSI